MAPCLMKGWYKRRSTSSYFLDWWFVRQRELGRHAMTGSASSRSCDYASIAHATLRTQEFLKTEKVTWMDGRLKRCRRPTLCYTVNVTTWTLTSNVLCSS